MKPPYKEGEPSFVHFLTILKIILDLFLLYLLILYFLITWRSRLFDFLKANVSGFRKKILSRLITRKNLQRNKSYCIALKKFEPQSLTQKNSRTWNNSPTHPYPPPSELKWSVLSMQNFARRKPLDNSPWPLLHFGSKSPNQNAWFSNRTMNPVSSVVSDFHLINFKTPAL